jgi:hypothetical protein
MGKKDIIRIIHVLVQRRLDDLPSKQNKHDTKKRSNAVGRHEEKKTRQRRPHNTLSNDGQKKITTTYLRGETEG